MGEHTDAIAELEHEIGAGHDVGVAAPHLASLECLRIHREARGDVLLAELCESPVFGRLRELAFVCSRVTDAGAETLLAARPHSARGLW